MPCIRRSPTVALVAAFLREHRSRRPRVAQFAGSAPASSYSSGNAWATLTLTRCSTRSFGNGESIGNRSAPGEVV